MLTAFVNALLAFHVSEYLMFFISLLKEVLNIFTFVFNVTAVKNE